MKERKCKKKRVNKRKTKIIMGGILLLAAFKEKSKKDYTRNIELAQKRLKMLDI